MKMRLGIFALFASTFVLTAFAQSVQLGFQRNGANSIVLTCRDSQSQSTIAGASFFRNGTIPVQGQSGGPGVLSFTITRETEGDYTCVNGQSTQSDVVTIVAYPTMSAIPPPPPTYTLVGQSIQVNCAVAPGALLQQYTVTWTVPGPMTISSNQPGSRYRINPVNLSLIIDDVQLSDASDEYRCMLRVVDPRSGATQTYGLLNNVRIPLVVLDHPSITRVPESRVVRQGESVTFNCEATGSPLPEIVWKHKEREILDDDSEYSIDTDTDDSGTISSELTLFSAGALDSGYITCEARVPGNADTGRIQLMTARETTRLSVLGDFRDIEIRITVDRDVIFDLDLPTQLQDPVHLYLVYRNTDNSAMDTKITPATYTNLQNIRHIEFDSDVNFERFEVSVALRSGEVTGPLMFAGSYDKSVPNTPLRELIRQTPVIAITSALVILLVCFLIFIAYIVNKCIMCHRRKFQNEEKRTCNDLKKVAKNTKGPLAPKKVENCDLVDGIVNEAIGPTTSSRSQDVSGGPPPPPTFTTPKDRIRRMMSRQKSKEYDLEAGQGTLSGGSRAITKFVANTLYTGLTDPQHKGKFKQIVQKLMEEADKVNPQAENVDLNHTPPGQNHELPSYQETVNPAYESVRSVRVSVYEADEDLDNKDDAEIDRQTA